MTDSALQITNLLHRYAEAMDSGDFPAAAELFRHAAIVVDHSPGARPLDADGILAIWEANVIRYDDGTPRTKHVVTNPIVDIDEADGTATCRSYYTVLQQVGDDALTPIVAGRYHDRFERVEGRWRFCERDYSLVDLVGDVGQHLRMEL